MSEIPQAAPKQQVGADTGTTSAQPLPNLPMMTHDEAEALRLRILKQERISAVMVAVLIHALILVGLGLWGLGVLETEKPDIEARIAPSTENTVERRTVQTETLQRRPSSPSQSAKLIAAAIPESAVFVPEVTFETDSLDIGTSANLGMGFGISGIGDGQGTSGTLFGRQVRSKNLGVILDISGSAHSHLDKAIAEIDKSFPMAHIILVVGCGMSDGKGAINGGGGKVPGKPRIIPYENIDSEKEYNSLARSAPAQLELFFRKAGDKRSKELRKYFKDRDNLYALYGADIHGANFAFDFLLELNVDTVYWFADFADRIDPKTIESLTKKLERSSVTVISHNFTGKPVGKLATEMTEKTGGQTIESIPGEE